ncbi:helix-turn-helix DNA binding domain protein [Rhodobacter phage RcKvothe]|nr:helix-turn-helix DNA binding domain protein [Rhodobacter phage RcDormio]QXN71902.1 helix-turn-helix DNA binding domain protein [Rhodobacter phage RcOceanus]UUV43921.1 helix-turn-helix DNA binding domain protein [Rhodobacter phage RcKvothe]UUV44896.1 helix-turn-helix DNA binding domain protein [Rhodobacter phage RcSwan]
MMEPDDLHEPKPCPTPTVIAVAILERAVLAVLIDVGDRNPETNFVGLRRVASETGIGTELVRAILRQLRDKGLAVYSAGLWSEDGDPRGAGYAASEAAMKRGATINGNDRKARQ